MAESAAQSLSTQLETQQDESCKSSQLLQALFASLAESSSGGSISPAFPQGAEPCSLNRQMAAGLPDQAKAQLVISHVQAVISSSAAQQQQLSMLTQQLERYSSDSATAKATLQAAAQAFPQLKPQPADSSLALSHTVLLEEPQSRQAEQLTQHLRLAEAQVADSGVRAHAMGGEIQTLQQQMAQAQAELQQVLNEPKTQAGCNQFCMSIMHQYSNSRGSHHACVMCVILFHLFIVATHQETLPRVTCGLTVCFLPICLLPCPCQTLLPLQSAFLI